jgi:D-beta-D-heptose 7-phosphate kinase/D-beta-D-heptose 1-phosphate adenosyltransferase
VAKFSKLRDFCQKKLSLKAQKPPKTAIFCIYSHIIHKRQRNMIAELRKARVLIVGDVMLDQYYMGGVGRISPEAPVPVVQVKKEEFRLGGAANVAANVAGLKAQVQLLGFAGDDSRRRELEFLLRQSEIKFELIHRPLPTITKTRIVGDRQQVVRLDFEEIEACTQQEVEEMQGAVNEALHNNDVLIISDYGKGTCTPEMCQMLIQEAHKQNIPVLVDPKTSDWSRYKGSYLITPNFKEFQEACQATFANEDGAVERQAPNLNKWSQNLLITRSEKGMTLTQKDQAPLHIHTEAREVYDVSGAGDTVIATIATAVAAGWELEDAVRLANRAAGVVVQKAGTAPVLAEELADVLHETPKETFVQSRDVMTAIVQKMRKDGKKVVFTNGCFDILHRGHADYLQRARELGDVLVVGLNSDESVRRLKGASRPVNKAEDRAFLLNALEAVDFVVLFEEDTPYELLEALRPNMLVKGGDYKIEEVIGREFADEVGILSFVNGFSTTATIERMK